MIESLIGILNAVGYGFQNTLGKELLVSADKHVSFSTTVQVLLKSGRINGLFGLSIETVPTQDVISCASDKDVAQYIGQIPLTLLNLTEVFTYIGRVYWQIGDVVGVEELNLMEHVPRAFVAGRGGKKTAAPPGPQERLDDLIALCIGMAKVVAFVNEHKIAVAVHDIIEY